MNETTGLSGRHALYKVIQGDSADEVVAAVNAMLQGPSLGFEWKVQGGLTYAEKIGKYAQAMVFVKWDKKTDVSMHPF